MDYAELFDRDFREHRQDKVLTHRAAQRYDRAFELIRDLRVGRALDIGCADGEFARRLLAISNTVVGIDVSETAIKQAMDKCPPYAQFWIGNLTNIPFSDSMFHFVSCLDVIYYLDNEGRRKSVDELARVLKKDGYLLISTSWPRGTKTRTGTSYLHGWELELLLGNRFKFLKSTTTGRRFVIPTGQAILFRYEPQ